MQCRNCGTEIADKAIVCYRCGTATTDPVRKPVEIRRRRSPALLLILIAAALVIALLLARSYHLFGLDAWLSSADVAAILIDCATLHA